MPDDLVQRNQFDFWPAGEIRLHVLMDDFGQPDADKLLQPFAFPALRFEVEENGYQVADTAEIEIDLEELPIDPQIVRGITVEVLQWRLDGLDEDYSIRAQRDLAADVLFVGICDRASSVAGDDGRSMTLTCRDYTAYFLDVQPTTSSISFERNGKKLSLREVYQDVIDQREETKAITIDDRSGLADTIFPADYYQQLNGKTKKRRTRSRESAWELMLSIAVQAGMLLYIEKDQLVIQRPSTLYEGDIEEPLVWTLGHDISDLTIERDFSRKTGVYVQVISNVGSGGTQRRLVSRFPKTDSAHPADLRQPAVPRLDDAGRQPRERSRSLTVTPYVMNGITSQAQLDVIAEQLYAQHTQREVSAQFNTAQMTDSNGIEVSRMRYGDPVRIETALTLDSTLADPREQKVRKLLAAGWSHEQSEAITVNVDYLLNPWYLHNRRHSFDNETGYELSVGLRARAVTAPPVES